MDLPAWIDADAWNGFVEMRIRIKKPLTERAKVLAVNKLEKLLKQGQDPTKILDESTFNSWQGLFAVKEDYGLQKQSSGGRSTGGGQSFRQRDEEETERIKQKVRSRLGFPGGGARLDTQKNEYNDAQRGRENTTSHNVIDVQPGEIIKS